MPTDKPNVSENLPKLPRYWVDSRAILRGGETALKRCDETGHLVLWDDAKKQLATLQQALDTKTQECEELKNRVAELNKCKLHEKAVALRQVLDTKTQECEELRLRIAEDYQCPICGEDDQTMMPCDCQLKELANATGTEKEGGGR